jgi:tetratricopeptide (TPR) repeat protein
MTGSASREGEAPEATIAYSSRMSVADVDWEERLSELWTKLDVYDDVEFIDRVESLVAELPPVSAIALFERGAAFDSTGHPERAVPLYRSALENGLVGERRRRAVIQMASSLRNLGDPQEALTLLNAETDVASDNLDGAVATFRALALVDLGREREAVAVALMALSKYLPRYNRSVARYAQELAEEGT